MGALDVVALVVIIFLIIAFAAVIVVLGGIPGKIARKRNHPYPDAVNAASWIGLATGIFWPIAFIWAFMTTPSDDDGEPVETASPDSEPTADTPDPELAADA
jgi:uncharacterized BrkB/YihY/UPF0761 family membrane protein